MNEMVSRLADTFVGICAHVYIQKKRKFENSVNKELLHAKGIEIGMSHFPAELRVHQTFIMSRCVK